MDQSGPHCPLFWVLHLLQNLPSFASLLHWIARNLPDSQEDLQVSEVLVPTFRRGSSANHPFLRYFLASLQTWVLGDVLYVICMLMVLPILTLFMLDSVVSPVVETTTPAHVITPTKTLEHAATMILTISLKRQHFPLSSSWQETRPGKKKWARCLTKLWH